MTPQTLWDYPKSRKTDAVSSHEAAATLKESGAWKSQQVEVLEAMKRIAGSGRHVSSKEIAERCGLDRHMVAKRLPELKDAGLIGWTGKASSDLEYCPFSRRRVVKWWVFCQAA